MPSQLPPIIPAIPPRIAPIPSPPPPPIVAPPIIAPAAAPDRPEPIMRAVREPSIAEVPAVSYTHLTLPTIYSV